MKEKSALITGITGQDGSYLAEFLLGKGYKVFGFRRRLSVPNTTNIAHLMDDIRFISADMHDQSSMLSALKEAKPTEVYNLAAQSFVPDSWHQAVLTGEVNALGVTRMLDAIKAFDQTIRFYQASTSEMFGKVQATPQNEETRFYPRSPYGVAKVYAHYMTINYRESYGLFACSGILFNHESPRRGEEFVTRKITNAAARIKLGLQDKLTLGNLDSERDWGFAGDYVRAMWMILQHDKPDDYVVSSGKKNTVRRFVEAAFESVGMPISWEGKDMDTKGYDPDRNLVVDVSEEFYRPAEVHSLLGDSTKIREVLGWEPEVDVDGLMGMMVEADIGRATEAKRLADIRKS